MIAPGFIILTVVAAIVVHELVFARGRERHLARKTVSLAESAERLARRRAR